MSAWMDDDGARHGPLPIRLADAAAMHLKHDTSELAVTTSNHRQT
jgi:hypothetical protein